MSSHRTITNACLSINNKQKHLNQQSSQQKFTLASLQTTSSSSRMSGIDAWSAAELQTLKNVNFTSFGTARSGQYDIFSPSSHTDQHFQIDQLVDYPTKNHQFSSSTDNFAMQQKDFVEFDDSNQCTEAIFADTNGLHKTTEEGSSLNYSSTAVCKIANDTIPGNTFSPAIDISMTNCQYSHSSSFQEVPSKVFFDPSTSSQSTNESNLPQESTAIVDNLHQDGQEQHFSGSKTSTAVASVTDTALEGNGSSNCNGVEDSLGQDGAEPEIDIVINNVVCSFSVRCHLNLRDIALNGDNVEFRRENGMVTMKLRRPYTTASIWSSGKITCTGATSEDQAKIAARRYTRCLQKLGFNVKFRNFRVVNVLGTCSMPWGIMIVNFSEKYKKDASYEPELHPGVTYRLEKPKATLKIFSTGSITVTAARVAYVQEAIEHIYPLVYEFRKKRSHHEKLELIKQQTAFNMQHIDSPVTDFMEDWQSTQPDPEERSDESECKANAENRENYSEYINTNQDGVHYSCNQPITTKAKQEENTFRLGLRQHTAGLTGNVCLNGTDFV